MEQKITTRRMITEIPKDKLFTTPTGKISMSSFGVLIRENYNSTQIDWEKMGKLYGMYMITNILDNCEDIIEFIENNLK